MRGYHGGVRRHCYGSSAAAASGSTQLIIWLRCLTRAPRRSPTVEHPANNFICGASRGTASQSDQPQRWRQEMTLRRVTTHAGGPLGSVKLASRGIESRVFSPGGMRLGQRETSVQRRLRLEQAGFRRTRGPWGGQTTASAHSRPAVPGARRQAAEPRKRSRPGICTPFVGSRAHETSLAGSY